MAMQNILVPTDFSRNAFHALRYAVELLKEKECTFFLLNAYGGRKGFKYKSTAQGTASSEDLKRSSKARLNDTLRKIKNEAKNPKHKFRTVSEPRNLIHAVPALIDALQIDMVVLGNKGQKSSIPVFLGGTTTKTLRTVKKCPVLTVPKNATFQIPSEIAFATDFRKSYDKEVLDVVGAWADLFDAKIRIVHIDEEEKLDEVQKSNLNSLLEFFGALASSVDRIPNFVSKTKIMQLFLEKSDIDMLCMVGHEHGLLEKVLREPVIERMVPKINIPFFVVPEAL